MFAGGFGNFETNPAPTIGEGFAVGSATNFFHRTGSYFNLTSPTCILHTDGCVYYYAAEYPNTKAHIYIGKWDPANPKEVEFGFAIPTPVTFIETQGYHRVCALFSYNDRIYLASTDAHISQVDIWEANAVNSVTDGFTKVASTTDQRYAYPTCQIIGNTLYMFMRRSDTRFNLGLVSCELGVWNFTEREVFEHNSFDTHDRLYPGAASQILSTSNNRLWITGGRRIRPGGFGTPWTYESQIIAYTEDGGNTIWNAEGTYSHDLTQGPVSVADRSNFEFRSDPGNLVGSCCHIIDGDWLLKSHYNATQDKYYIDILESGVWRSVEVPRRVWENGDLNDQGPITQKRFINGRLFVNVETAPLDARRSLYEVGNDYTRWSLLQDLDFGFYPPHGLTTLARGELTINPFWRWEPEGVAEPKDIAAEERPKCYLYGIGVPHNRNSPRTLHDWPLSNHTSLTDVVGSWTWSADAGVITNSTGGPGEKSHIQMGSGDTLTQAASREWDGTHEGLSFSVWIKPDVLGGTIVDWPENFSLSVTADGEIEAIVADSDGTTATITAPQGQVAAGLWYHIVLVSDRINNHKLYVSKSLVAESSTPLNSFPSTNATAMIVGQGYDGALSQMEVADGLWNAEEIELLFNDGALGDPVLEADSYVRRGANSGNNYDGENLLLKESLDALDFHRDIVLSFSNVPDNFRSADVVLTSATADTGSIEVRAIHKADLLIDETTVTYDSLEAIPSWAIRDTSANVNLPDTQPGDEIRFPILNMQSRTQGTVTIRLECGNPAGPDVYGFYSKDNDPGGLSPRLELANPTWKPKQINPPRVEGTPEVGQVLTTAPGAWAGDGEITYSYQWLRDGVAISGATNATYTLVAADAETDVSCEVTATNFVGSNTATSNAVTVI